jgi:hypothetical protein
MYNRKGSHDAQSFELRVLGGDIAKGKNQFDIQGTFSEHSGNIQGTFKEHSGNIR